jgi:hypothetical protein
VKQKQLSWTSGSTVKRWTQRYNLYVPKGEGPKSTICLETKEVSRGIATDRNMRKTLEAVNGQINKAPRFTIISNNSQSSEDLVASAKSDAAESRLAIQQIVESSSPDADCCSIKVNPSVAAQAGLPFDTRHCPPTKTPNKTFFHAEAKPSNEQPKTRVFAASKDPNVTMNIVDSEVKRRTGFKDQKTIVAYIITVCDGSTDEIKRRCSSLTWFEEWFFHFEWKWGRTITRWLDGEKVFDVDAKILRKIHRNKLALERRIHGRWPKYASYLEDVTLRKPKWNAKYDVKNGVKTRPVMWDMTGIHAYQFGAGDLQRVTFSKYYAGNCVKGGIFVQTCDWGGDT